MKTKYTSKRVTIRVLALMLVLMLLLPIYSMARWSNIFMITCNISFSGELATCAVDVDAQPGTTRIEITVKLQRKISEGVYSDVKEWPTDVKTFSASDNNPWFYSIHQYYVPRNALYRTFATVSATRNGTVETVTFNSGDG